MRAWIITLVCIFFTFSTTIDKVYAGGGDDDDNWNNYNNGDDDDSYHNNDDDDRWNNDDDDNYGGNDDDDNDNDIPLDGGLSFLAIAGAGLGIKKIRDNRSKKKNNDK